MIAYASLVNIIQDGGAAQHLWLHSAALLDAGGLALRSIGAQKADDDHDRRFELTSK